MKRWAFLIVLLTGIQCICCAEITDSIPLTDSLASIFSNAPSESSMSESSLERSIQQQLAPADTACDTLSEAICFPIAQKHFTTEKVKKRKRLIAALLAFPLPFGIIGLHRIYLGTKPYVPLVYIATVGGVGIIPFIDFVVICLEKDISRYCNNSNIIMWAK